MVNIDNILEKGKETLFELRPKRTLKGIIHTFSKDRDAIWDLPRWLIGKSLKTSTIESELPWMCFSATRWLEKQVTAESRVLEFGSGGSTLFWSSRAAHVVSIEHDVKWFNKVKELLSERRQNVEYRLVEADKDGGYSAYVKSIKSEADKSFDFVVVDGMDRVDCMRAALPKVKDGGYLILDNSQRDDYFEGKDELSDYPRWDFEGITPTSVMLPRTTAWKIVRD